MPGNANLGWLHAVIQLAMGWTNSHLHQFKVGGRLFSDPRVNYAEFEGDPEILDEAKFSLRDLAPYEKDVLHYEYDFGDGWQHTIIVEKILPPEPDAATVAVCLAGKRACPPDDCGGSWGYQNLLKILRNPKHEEHNTMQEWLGRPFDRGSVRSGQHERALTDAQMASHVGSASPQRADEAGWGPGISWRKR